MIESALEGEEPREDLANARRAASDQEGAERNGKDGDNNDAKLD